MRTSAWSWIIVSALAAVAAGCGSEQSGEGPSPGTGGAAGSGGTAGTGGTTVEDAGADDASPPDDASAEAAPDASDAAPDSTPDGSEGDSASEAGWCSVAEGGLADGSAVNPDDPCATLTATGEPPARVAWVSKGDPLIEITNQISLLWGFQYVSVLPAGAAADYSIVHERCEQAAGMPESCTTFDLPVADECNVAFAPKFGIDPSQYLPGDNHYRFAMRLLRGCELVSEDSFDILVRYTP